MTGATCREQSVVKGANSGAERQQVPDGWITRGVGMVL
jgi:hypothetical protein